MCKILLSINPEYVNQILNKTKIYEFRKVKCKKNIDNIVIYATSPISRVVAEVKVEEILEDMPENIWNITREFSGITHEYFLEYYKNREKAIAYRLGKVKKYKTPKSLNEFGIKSAHQSFIYL